VAPFVFLIDEQYLSARPAGHLFSVGDWALVAGVCWGLS